MDSNKITVVTGEPRSGTSLMMQTLRHLGVPIAGMDFPMEVFEEEGVAWEATLWSALRGPIAPEDGPFEDDEGVVVAFIKDGKYHSAKEVDTLTMDQAQRRRHANIMNPKGFYEVPGVVASGLRNIQHFKGKAIKIITLGALDFEFPNGKKVGTPSSLVDKYIMCSRNPLNIAVSQQDLVGSVSVLSEDEEWEYSKQQVSASRYITHTGNFAIWLGKQDQEVFDKILVIDYEDMILEPEECIKKIIAHLGIDPSEHQVSQAIQNVDPTLFRSVDLKAWPKEMEPEGFLADMIYEGLKILDRTSLQTLAAESEQYIADKRLEMSRWVDEETWITVNPFLARAIVTNDNNVKLNLLERLKRKRADNLVCDKCSHYSRDTEKTYETERPVDLGNLVRPMVKCGRDKDYKMVEECKHCWLSGWLSDGAMHPPQRLVGE